MSGGLEWWPGIRRRLDLVELGDGSGGLAGLAAGWVFVERAGEDKAVVLLVVVESVMSGAAGGGSGCEVEAAFGFDLAADANSAGNGVLLAAMPQAYSISLLSFSLSLSLLYSPLLTLPLSPAPEPQTLPCPRA